MMIMITMVVFRLEVFETKVPGQDKPIVVCRCVPLNEYDVLSTGSTVKREVRTLYCMSPMDIEPKTI